MKEVTLGDRFQPAVAWPIAASFLAWVALIILFAIEFSGHYFVDFFIWAVAFTAVGGVAWLIWTIILIYDQRCGDMEDEERREEETAARKRGAKLLILADRSGPDHNVFMGGWFITTFFTILLVLFIWTRYGYMKEIRHHSELVALIDGGNSFEFTEKDTLLDFEAGYVIAGGLYAAFGSVIAFFAASGRIQDEVDKQNAMEDKTS